MCSAAVQACMRLALASVASRAVLLSPCCVCGVVSCARAHGAWACCEFVALSCVHRLCGCCPYCPLAPRTALGLHAHTPTKGARFLLVTDVAHACGARCLELYIHELLFVQVNMYGILEQMPCSGEVWYTTLLLLQRSGHIGCWKTLTSYAVTMRRLLSAYHYLKLQDDIKAMTPLERRKAIKEHKVTFYCQCPEADCVAAAVFAVCQGILELLVTSTLWLVVPHNVTITGTPCTGAWRLLLPWQLRSQPPDRTRGLREAAIAANTFACCRATTSLRTLS